MSKSHSITKSFPFAFQGIKQTLKDEPNFRLHLIFAFLAVVLSLYLKLNHFELALIVLTSTIVLVMELFNTVMEAFVDLVSPEIRPKAKIVKDAAAAGVLISSLGALIIGAIIFLPKIPGL